ncbi:hypothetical protein PsorP6_002689 [Peronosclerospora sorghi]|uniref:Uncharacterized protein n=1 Tax=Peronosclerospora sorghi TaxID=230839 RepID=A0ACC0WUZ4_9STRA|nr:hypothetical protein PsorP6_002689 [Peronosclerospora sorghi]
MPFAADEIKLEPDVAVDKMLEVVEEDSMFWSFMAEDCDADTSAPPTQRSLKREELLARLWLSIASPSLERDMAQQSEPTAYCLELR